MASILQLDTDDRHFIFVSQERISPLCEKSGGSSVGPDLQDQPRVEENFNHWCCVGSCDTVQCADACMRETGGTVRDE